jgi:hypothetical protein
MRRALLFVLAATVIVAAGWSAIVAMSTPAPLMAPLTAATSAAATPIEIGRTVVDDAVVPTTMRAAAPAARLLVGRDRALTAAAAVVLGAAFAVAVAPPRVSRAEAHGAPPRRGPALRVAPHRGPPAGLARPSGT